MRKKLLIRNTWVSFINQGVTIICGFILPRLILQQYGSQVNGLVASISQFLSFISLLELGMGSVVKSSLYEPLASKDYDGISKVVVSTSKFFRKIAFVLVVYTIILAFCLPFGVGENFDFFFTASLVFIISISTFAQYYFGMSNQLLLNADQKNYIPTLTNCWTLVLNTLMSAVLIKLGVSIQMVKLAASLIYVIRPMVLQAYVNKNYKLNLKITYEEEPIKQKWNGMAQHLAFVVLNNTDIIVLTVCSTLVNVSIYTVYHNVTNGVYKVISSLSVGIAAMLGNVLYSESKETLQKIFAEVEWFFHVVTVFLFTVTGILILPFVKVYTTGVQDAQYTLSLFALLMTLAQAVYSIRTPYQTIVYTAGHYKQTQTSSIIEMLMNIAISVVLVFKWGIIGVAIGTLVALFYRTMFFVFYLRKNILSRNLVYFFKNIGIDLLEVICTLTVCQLLFRGLYENVNGWYSLITFAIIISIVCGIVCLIINMIFCRNEMNSLVKKLLSK